MSTSTSWPAWLPLLRRPYDDILGTRAAWNMTLPDGTPVHVERGNQGFNNAVYQVQVAGQAYACKLFVVDERRRAEREWAALVALHAAGLALAPVPVAFAPDGPLPQPAVVASWIAGASLAGQSLCEPDLQALVAGMAAIHRVAPVGDTFLPAWHQPSGFSEYLVEAHGFLQPVVQWAAGVAAPARDLPGWASDLPALLPMMEDALARAEADAAACSDGGGACPVPSLVRLDGNLENIVRQPDGRLAYLGWEYSGWGDPAFELAELRWHPRSLGVLQPTWEAALACYPTPPGDPEFRARLAVYSRLVPVWWVARSALYLLEGAGLLPGRQRLVRMPARLFRSLRSQLDAYLVVLGLIAPSAPDDEPADD